MIKKTKRILSVFIAVLLTVGALSGIWAGAAAYRSYVYDGYGTSIESVENYKTETVLTGRQLGTTSLKSPADLYVDDATGTIYILDSGNGRVLILDSDLKLKGEISSFTYQGQELELKNPTSLFVQQNGEVLIADAENEFILVSSLQGEVKRIITRPEDEQYPSDVRFSPQRIVADDRGNIYAVITGIYDGAAVFDSNGEFQRFFGSNEITISAELLWDYFWKQVLSDEQKSSLARYVPVEFTSLDIDAEGFVYTVTPTDDNTKMLRKLNFIGNTIVHEQPSFGDLETQWDMRNIITVFSDVCVDARGNVYGLDLTRGHIFQYDKDFNLVCVIGSLDGSQEGTFKLPNAIDTLGDRILVLDTDRASLTVFTPTDFGQKVLAALDLQHGGYYLEAMAAWQEVRSRNENYLLAYQGIADGQYMLGQYHDAMESYRLAADRSGYLEAYREYRSELLHRSFPFIFAAIVVLLAGVVFLVKRTERKRRLAPAEGFLLAEKTPNRMLYSLRVLTHPIDSYETMKAKKLFSVPASLIIVALFFLTNILSYLYTGFGYNFNDPSRMNIFILMASSIGLFVLWTVSNYLFCTLYNGKGFFKEIWCASAYALLPYIILTCFVTLASNFVVTEEYTLVSYIGVIGLAWSAVLMIIALKTIHDYSVLRTVAVILLTILGIVIVVFLLALSFTVYNEVISLIGSVARELMFRM